MIFSIKGLTTHDYELLASFLVKREFPRNAVIYEKGRPADAIYFIEQGLVKIFQGKPDNASDDVLYAYLRSGRFFGEETLLGEDSNYFHTALALENTIVFELTKEAFQKLMARSISTGSKLLLGISKVYREALVENKGRVLVFYSPKDGVGKTAIAVNFAVLIAQISAKRVAFLDFDLQFGNANIFLDLPVTPNIGNLVQIEPSLHFERIKNFVQNKFGIDWLFSPDKPQESELITRTSASNILQEFIRNYDFVIVDSKSYIDEQTLLFWDLADKIILVSNPDLGALLRLVKLFKLFRRLDYSSSRFLFLLNRFKKEDEDIKKEFQKRLATPLVVLPEENTLINEAQNKGVPIISEFPNASFSTTLAEFGKNFLGIAQPVSVPKNDGILSRLKSVLSGL